MKIVHAVPYIGDEASGPAYSVRATCETLAAQGADVALYTLSPCPEIPGMTVHAYPRHNWPHPSLGRSPEMLTGLRQAAQKADIMHNHSLWMMNNIYPLQAIKGTKCQLVCSPHGTMAPWAWRRSRWKKILIGWLGQNAALESTKMFHATSEAEYLDIRRLGFKQPIALINNGIHVNDHLVQSHRTNIVLYLGRIHLVKGIDMLLEAWGSIAEKYPEWELHIVGPTEKTPFFTQLEFFIKNNRVPRVLFIGPLFGPEKFRAYAQAKFFVLPTHTENFGMVVAEALAHGTPCIVTKGAPWEGLQTHDCGWWIDRTHDELCSALESAMSTPETKRAAMGARGRSWMAEEYSWTEVATKLTASYAWMLHGGMRPAWVHLD